MILHGDCVEQMRELPESSIDAICTDPPYNLGFMSKPWDIQHDHEPWSREAFRVLKPGGHLLAFGGTRTYHRLACAVEDAGFEIRDSLIWLYGSGFPKSLDVSKAIDKAAGKEREHRIDPRWIDRYPNGPKGNTEAQIIYGGGDGLPRRDEPITTSDPATPEAQKWNGWGTALKPAHEPIVVARKPLAGTVAQNVTEHGTGALNIEACRIGTDENLNGGAYAEQGGREDLPGAVRSDAAAGMMAAGKTVAGEFEQPPGRWPANVALSPEAAAELDEQSGELMSGANPTRRGSDKFRTAYGDFEGQRECDPARGVDRGGASRFFYCAKASRGERNAGLDGFEEQATGVGDERTSGDFNERLHRGERTTVVARNSHPTVKPIDLMRWLVRLVTPPGGTVLDPFTGSGTTGVATVLEGFDFIGIEREAEYVAIAEARVAFWEQHAGRDTVEVLIAAGLAERIQKEHTDRGQLGLLDA